MLYKTLHEEKEQRQNIWEEEQGYWFYVPFLFIVAGEKMIESVCHIFYFLVLLVWYNMYWQQLHK